MSKKTPTSSPRRPWLDANDLRARTLIRDVLAGYDLLEQMTQHGASLQGPSPFHEGGDPSFRVDLERGLWNDFQGRPEGCKGNVIGLVQALEGCSFAQALHVVADRFASPATEPTGPTAAPLHAVPMAPAPATAEPVERDLVLSGPGTASRAALPPERRVAPGPEALDPAEQDLEEAPLFGKELRGLRYDVPLLLERDIQAKVAQAYGVGYCMRGLMKSRLVAPVRTAEGEIAGYVGRSLKAVPRTELWKNPAGFPRSRYLFGLHRMLDTGAGRKAVKDYGLIVVQSPLDVLRLATAGFPNAVALMAASASRAQLHQLTNPTLNPTRRVTLLLDNDEAGHRGKREAAGYLIRQAFVRYACWNAIEATHSSPDRLTDEELRPLLALSRPQHPTINT